MAAAQPPGGAARSAAATAEFDGHVLGGWRAFEAKRYADAFARFSRAEQIAPEREDVQVGLGEALFWLGEHRRAVEHFERAARLAPSLARAHSGAGHAYLNLAARTWQTPRTSRALLARANEAFARALALDPQHASARAGQRMAADLRGSPSSLFLLECVIAVLLLALVAAALLRARRHGVPRLREYLWPLVLFVVTRALVFTAFAAAPALLAEAPQHPQQVLRDPERFVLDCAAGRWDSNLYALVAISGYALAPADDASAWGSVGQFPLVPVLLRWLALALDDAPLAALILPNAALLLACLVLFELFRARYGTRVAVGAVCVMLVHPASLHGSVLYAESLALLGLSGLALNLQRGALASAALWGTFAGLARINALAIVPWLLLDWFRGEGGRQRSLRSLAACLSPLLGLALFMLFTQLEFGNAFTYFEEMRGRRLGSGPLLGTLVEARNVIAHVATMREGRIGGGPLPVQLLGLACLAIYIAAAIALVRERSFGPALFVGSGILLGLTSTLAAQPRYLWLLFPAAVVLARACDRPLVRWAAPLASACVLVAAAVAYARWYFLP